MKRTTTRILGPAALSGGLLSGLFSFLFALNGYSFASEIVIRWCVGIFALCSAVAGTVLFQDIADKQEEIDRLEKKYEPKPDVDMSDFRY